MSLGIWGNAGWTFMHFITFAYPNNPSVSEKAHYKQFFNSIPHILPCPRCRNHFAENIKKHPLDKALESREKLVQWLVDMHNEVNISKGKPEWTKDQVMKYYIDMSNGRKEFNLTKVLCVGAGIGLFVWALVRYSRKDKK